MYYLICKGASDRILSLRDERETTRDNDTPTTQRPARICDNDKSKNVRVRDFACNFDASIFLGYSVHMIWSVGHYHNPEITRKKDVLPAAFGPVSTRP